MRKAGTPRSQELVDIRARNKNQVELFCVARVHALLHSSAGGLAER